MKQRIELKEAYSLFEEHIKPKTKIIKVSLHQALGKILAQDIFSTLDQPPFHKSAVDGYAFKYEESKGASRENPVRFEVIEQVYAGHVASRTIQTGQAIQIMTGACVPDCCDCVIRLEDTNDSIEELEVYQECKYFDNICKKGEDFKEGDLLLKKGTKLDYICLGILSSIGMDAVEIYEPVKIAFYTTGDEIQMPGTQLQPGKIYDSNYMLLSNRLQSLGYPIEIHKHIVDDAKSCGALFKESIQKYDFILTTGAVSVGKKDIIHDALEYAGAEKIFWRVKLKPGTPAIFSMLEGKPILSLSGNPFAASCTFELLARYVLSILSQDEALKVQPRKAILTNAFKKGSKQRRFVRAIYKEGKVMVPTGMHSPNELGSMIGCNALLDIPGGITPPQKNEEVTVWLL
ncbi:MAG: molybdopterin molybdotransferase MoeA [Firmicutes bacterium]|nr:molybdopterin molybdotransferase MoeA [Bacillota bacterium]